MKNFDQQEKRKYLNKLVPPNRAKVMRLPMMEGEGFKEKLNGILDCLRDEYMANSFDGRSMAQTRHFIDPIKEGFVDPDELEIWKWSNSRAIWANSLTMKLTFLFGFASKSEQEAKMDAIATGVELALFASENPEMREVVKEVFADNAKMVKQVVRQGVEEGMEKPTKEIRDVLHRHTSPAEELSRIESIKKAYDRLGTWTKVAADIIGMIDHERKQGKPNPKGNPYLEPEAYKKLIEELKTKTPKSLVKTYADTLSRTVRRFDDKQKRGKIP